MDVAIIGGGLAAATLATELRKLEYDGSVSIFSDEAHLPYERPPLSKGLLLGTTEEEKIFVHDEQWYRENDVDLHLQQRVTKFDPQEHTLQAGGETHSFEKLVLATGSAPRILPEANASGKPVFYLRTLDHSRELSAAFKNKPDVAIVGGGWIGLEVAAAARAAGCKVTAYVAEDLPLEHVVGPEVAPAFLDLHQSHGVQFELGHLAKADELAEHDIVVCGVGADPRISLALTAGLKTDAGVLVDSALRTSHPDVYAIGDIAEHDHPLLGERIMIGHWDNAIQQGRHVASNIAQGPTPYERQPYFFSDQYDLGMEYFGHATGDVLSDPVIEGDLHGAFRVWWVKDGVVVAAMQANDWDASKELREGVGKALVR
jgi:NADPH-dependent 2,4-dienoyl-CoA reductase/sulfur reductase-like enzyme